MMSTARWASQHNYVCAHGFKWSLLVQPDSALHILAAVRCPAHRVVCVWGGRRGKGGACVQVCVQVFVQVCVRVC